MEKLTWYKIFEDFKNRHPSLSNLAVRHRPYDVATIQIDLKGGTRMVYDYERKRAVFLSSPAP